MSSQVTFMADRSHGTRSTGVTADQVWRTHKHCEGLIGKMNPKWEDLGERLTR